MEIADLPIRNTEAWIVSGTLWVWGDVRDDVNDKLDWEFEDCEMGSVTA